MTPIPTHPEFWDQRASREAGREEANPCKRIHTDLHWREVERRLDGVKTILDAGAGVGRFSIPLARRGFEVTHLDLSPEMLRLAEEKAQAENLKTIRFLQGSVTDLSAFSDQAFDLVLCFDSPVSFAYPHHMKALRELARVSGKTLIVSVANRLGNLAAWVQGDVLIAGKWKTAHRIWRDGIFEADEEILALHPPIIPGMYFFRPEEIRAALENQGLRLVSMRAPAGLARLLSTEAIEKLLALPEMYQEFLDLSEAYEAEVLVGMETGGNLLVTTVR